MGRCERCGIGLDPSDWHCHHRKFRSRGGRDEVANAVALCGDCHTAAPYAVHRDQRPAERSGLNVASTDEPETVPVHLYGGRIVALADDGRYVPLPMT